MTTNTDGAMPELPDNDIDGEEIGKIIADCTVTFEGGFSHLDNDMFASVIRSAMEDYARAAIQQAAGAVPEGWKDRLLHALERAAAVESALRALVDECDNDKIAGWEERMGTCIDNANRLLSAPYITASAAPPKQQQDEPLSMSMFASLADFEAAKKQQPDSVHLAACAGTAKLVRGMGIKVGDTIFGRESGNGYDGYWHEARLTLLWVGQSEAVWLESGRSNKNPEWSEPVETADWTLDAREWSKVTTPAPRPEAPTSQMNPVSATREDRDE